MGIAHCEYCQDPLSANAGFCGNCGKKTRGQSNIPYPANLSVSDLNDRDLITYQTILDDDAPTGISKGILPHNASPTIRTPLTPDTPLRSRGPAGGNWEQQVSYPISNKEEEEEDKEDNIAVQQLGIIAAPPYHSRTPHTPAPYSLGVHHPHHPHPSYHSQHASRRRFGCFATIASIMVIAIVIATFLITSLLHGHGRLSPAVTLGSSVVPGGNLSVHGSNFTAGGIIDITIDGQPVHLSGAASLSPRSSALNMSLTGAYQPSTGATETTIAVQNDGTFDALIVLDSTWAVGSKHTLQVVEQSSNLTAQMLIIVPQASTLVSCSQATTTTSLTLGPVTEGQTQPVSAPFTLCAAGTGIVNWNASWNTAQASWLQLPASGQIQAPLTKQIQISAVAGSLKAGTYTATVTFKSQDNTNDLTLNVTFDVRAAQATECINTNINTLTFSAIKGQPDPATQSVTITNCGTDHPWTATPSTDNLTNWLTTSVPSGGDNTLKAQASQDVTTSVTSANLQPGSYTGQVTFKIGASTATVNITFTVQPARKSDCISATPQTLTFTAIQGQANPPAQKTTIGNCGSTSTWNATQSTANGVSWLNIDTSTGSLNANATHDIAVSVTSTNLQQGTYTGQILFSLGASNVTVNVTLTIQVPQPKPCLAISSQNLTFTGTVGQSDPPAQTETLTNCGPTGTWTGTPSTKDGTSWLSIKPNGGNLAPEATQAVTVGTTIGKLSSGSYTGSIVFSNGTNSQTVNVAFTISPPPTPSPAMQLNTNTLIYSAGCSDPAAQTLTVSNTGGGTLTWKIGTPSQSWLTVTGGSSATPNQPVTLTFTVSIKGLANGSTTATVDITPSNGPVQTVTVNLTVQCAG